MFLGDSQIETEREKSKDTKDKDKHNNKRKEVNEGKLDECVLRNCLCVCA